MQRKHKQNLVKGIGVGIIVLFGLHFTNAQALTINVPIVPLPPIVVPTPSLPPPPASPVVVPTVPVIPTSVPQISLPVLNTTPSAPGLNPVSVVPSIISNVLSSTTPTATTTGQNNQTLIMQAGIPSVVNDIVWKSSDPSIKFSLANNTGDPEFDGSHVVELTQAVSGMGHIISHTFDAPQDWSGYSKLGFWIFSNVLCNAGDVKLILSPFKELSDSSEALVLSLPALSPGKWMYVSLDLDPARLHKVLSYGFSFVHSGPLTLNIRQFDLGPGLLHHFKILASTGGKDMIRISAEDINANILDSGTNVYSGAKSIIFKRSPLSITVEPAKNLQTTATVNFSKGLSDVISLSSIAPGISANDLDLTDGQVSTVLGDFSYNLRGASLPASNSSEMSPVLSTINVSPSPAKIGDTVLVTLVVRDAQSNQLYVPGMNVSAIITGANPQTFTMQDNGDGTYEATYSPLSLGWDFIKVQVNSSFVGSDSDGKSDGTFSEEIAKLTTPGPGPGPGPGPVGNPGGPTVPGGSGGGSGGGGGGGGGISGLITNVGCSPLITKYIKRGENNDPEEVRKLQTFLREKEGMVLVKINGVYDTTTFNAVKTFQAKYVKDVLSPWQTAIPTGYVYIKTIQKINEINCRNSLKQVASVVASNMSGSKICPVFTTREWMGKRDNEVIAIQKFLVDKGFMKTIASWGYYGSITKKAVQDFQKEYQADILVPMQIKEPTGQWLSQTIKKANELSNCK